MNPTAIRDKVAIVGMGCCKFGENWDQAPADMIVDAAYEAYADAGIDEPQRRIEAVFCGAQYPSRGTAEVADALKLYDRPVSMVVNYCATGTDAFRYGVFAVACGMYDTVLVVGFDKPKDRGVSGPSVAVTGVRVRLVRGVDDHVGGRLVPVLPELAAPHADDRDLVPDGGGVHSSAPRRTRDVLACTSSNSWASRRPRGSSGR